MRYIFIILLFFFSSHTFSQDSEFINTRERNKNKPSLFQTDSIINTVLPSFFSTISKVERHDIVTLEITKNTKLKGIVLEIIRTEAFISGKIVSMEIDNLTLIFSYRFLETKENLHRGLILSSKHKDVLILEKDSILNKYFWYKKEFSDLVPD